MYIYIYRERERYIERERCIYIYIYIYICAYTVYTYIEAEAQGLVEVWELRIQPRAATAELWDARRLACVVYGCLLSKPTIWAVGLRSLRMGRLTGCVEESVPHGPLARVVGPNWG